MVTLSSEEGRIVAALDGGREQVFFGLYEFTNGQAAKFSEQLLGRNEFLEELRGSHPVLVITSDHSLASMAAESAVNVQEVERPGSEIAARTGLRKLLAGNTISVDALDANYIRRSDAEIFFNSK
jgi:tRNA threonylcarbamoyladenosine biosynthesis protein TsaB